MFVERCLIYVENFDWINCYPKGCTDVVFSHEDDVYYARYVIKGEKDIKKNHDYTILRQVFDMAREGGDDWVEDRFYKGKKIE